MVDGTLLAVLWSTSRPDGLTLKIPNQKMWGCDPKTVIALQVTAYEHFEFGTLLADFDDAYG